MTHTCRTLVLHCIDFRLGKAINAYLGKTNHLGDCDIVSVAGAAKDLVSPAADASRDFILRQIDISKRLHNISRVILMNHTDCGAYGGRKAFASSEEEKNAHLGDMQKAQEYILTRHPDLSVKFVLAQIAENDEVYIEEV